MKCLLLAAGLGTRLLPLTLSRAKAAVPYRSRPLIAHCIRTLRAAGIDDFCINLHHLPDTVRRAVSAEPAAEGCRIRYSFEPEILGTAGALIPLRSWLGDETFLVVNAKIVFDLNLGEAIARHRESEAAATLIVVTPQGPGAFSPVLIDSEDRVSGFARTGATSGHPVVFTGIHIVGPRIWHYLESSGYRDMVQDVYQPALLRGERIGAYRASGQWFEFSTLRRYLALDTDQGEGSRGEGLRVAGSAIVTESVLWNHVTIGENCRLHRCVVADGARIPDGASFEDSALVPAALSTPEFASCIRGGLIVAPLEARC